MGPFLRFFFEFPWKSLFLTGMPGSMYHVVFKKDPRFHVVYFIPNLTRLYVACRFRGQEPPKCPKMKLIKIVHCSAWGGCSATESLGGGGYY